MNNREKLNGSHHSLRLLEEIAQGEALTQRDLSKRLGVALGLVNSYLKNLIAKGYITVKLIPPKRYAYYLTPTGFAEKASLTLKHLRNFTHIYRQARRDFRELFQELQAAGVKKVAFAGVDEVAEIAYLSLKEADLELTGVFDNDQQGGHFFGYKVKPVDEIETTDFERIILTGFMKREEHLDHLLQRGIPEEKIILPGIFRKTETHNSVGEELGFEFYKEPLEDFKAQMLEKFGLNLISLVVYGSVARGKATKQSDIDLLVILDKAPQSYYQRLQPILEIWAGLKEIPSYKKFNRQELTPYLSFLILTEEEANENRYIFLDMVESSIILIDRGDFFRKRLERIKRRLKELGSKKVLCDNGSWYWDLKPDLVPGEVFEL